MICANSERLAATFEDSRSAQLAVGELLMECFPGGRILLFTPGARLEKAGLAAAEAHYYQKAFRQGRTLVLVEPGDRYLEAVEVLDRCGGRCILPPHPAALEPAAGVSGNEG